LSGFAGRVALALGFEGMAVLALGFVGMLVVVSGFWGMDVVVGVASDTAVVASRGAFLELRFAGRARVVEMWRAEGQSLGVSAVPLLLHVRRRAQSTRDGSGQALEDRKAIGFRREK
jgi:hypothetical protein